jgi:hypothetical protein
MFREGMPADASDAEVVQDCERQARSLGAVSLAELDLVHEDDDSVRYHATYSVEGVDVGEVRVEIRLVRGPSRWLVDAFTPV